MNELETSQKEVLIMTTKEVGAVFPPMGSAAEAWEAAVRSDDMSLFAREAGQLEEAERLRRIAVHYRAEMAAWLRSPRFECEGRRTTASVHMSIRARRIAAGADGVVG